MEKEKSTTTINFKLSKEIVWNTIHFDTLLKINTCSAYLN